MGRTSKSVCVQVLLCLVVVSSAVLGQSGGAPAEAAAELRVMTFNIRYGSADDGDNRWPNRADLVFDVLRRHDPDVVGLQEALRFQIDEIRAALPAYGEIGVGRDDGKTEGEYSAILYRTDRLTAEASGTFWLSDTPEVPGSTSWGNTITRICTWGRFVQTESGRAFYLFNTHLDHQSQPSRERSALLLANRIVERARRDPVIVTGDFNAGEGNPAVRYLKGEIPLATGAAGPSKTPVPLVDTFRTLHAQATDVGTFNQFKGVRSGEKIDYIFVEPGRPVLEAAILYDNEAGRYPSDHFPVTAKLSLWGATTYFLDSEPGRHENEGSSAQHAWKTLAPSDRFPIRADTASSATSRRVRAVPTSAFTR